MGQVRERFNASNPADRLSPFLSAGDLANNGANDAG